MFPHQYLIGSVAVLIGTLALAGAVSNYEGLFQLAKVRMLESALGRRGARWMCALLGCGLIVLGSFIVAGWLPRKVSQTKPMPLNNELLPAAA